MRNRVIRPAMLLFVPTASVLIGHATIVTSDHVDLLADCTVNQIPPNVVRTAATGADVPSACTPDTDDQTPQQLQQESAHTS